MSSSSTAETTIPGPGLGGRSMCMLSTLTPFWPRRAARYCGALGVVRTVEEGWVLTYVFRVLRVMCECLHMFMNFGGCVCEC